MIIAVFVDDIVMFMGVVSVGVIVTVIIVDVMMAADMMALSETTAKSSQCTSVERSGCRWGDDPQAAHDTVAPASSGSGVSPMAAQDEGRCTPARGVFVTHSCGWPGRRCALQWHVVVVGGGGVAFFDRGRVFGQMSVLLARFGRIRAARDKSAASGFGRKATRNISLWPV